MVLIYSGWFFFFNTKYINAREYGRYIGFIDDLSTRSFSILATKLPIIIKQVRSLSKMYNRIN